MPHSAVCLTKVVALEDDVGVVADQLAAKDVLKDRLVRALAGCKLDLDAGMSGHEAVRHLLVAIGVWWA